MRHDHVKLFCAAVSALSVALPGGGWSAETKCPSISAVAYHSAKSTSAATEQDGKCKISIDGADASTQSIEPIVQCLFRMPFDQLFRIDRGMESDGWVAQQIIPLLITPSMPDNNSLTSDPGLALSNFDPVTCQQFFDGLVTNGGQPFDSPLHLEVANDPSLRDGIASCLADARSGAPSGPCRVSDGQLILEFSTSLGQHVLTLPLE